MQTKTQQADVGKALQDAVLQAAVDEGQKAASAFTKPGKSGNKLPGPGPGRPKGLQNTVTRTIREAVEKAARECHSDGLAGWLVERAQGGVQDRQIFAQMVSKAMPLQVNANVDGGIKLELSWLSGRSIGTVTDQTTEKRSQVIDLEQDSKGEYRIKHPAGGSEGQEPKPPKAAGGAQSA